MKPTTRFTLPLVALSLAGVLSGCHSAFIQATVVNTSGKPIQIFEVDYPNASFGAGQLAPGATFHYRFKVLGEGPAKLTWTDGAEHDHTETGPRLQEGEEGTMRIEIGPSSATWQPDLHPAR